MHKIVTAQIALIADDAWQPVAEYPTEAKQLGLLVLGVQVHATHDQAVVAERCLGQLADPAGATTRSSPNRSELLHDVDAEHRQHAVVELVIRDLKAQALAHFPSGHYNANSAWTVIACLAHNLGRWTDVLGLIDNTPRAAATIRRRLFAIPGRLTRPPDAGRCICPPAGPGRQTSSKRSRVSERSPPPEPPADHDCTAAPAAGAAASCPQPALAAHARAQLDAAQPTINPHNDSDGLNWPHPDNAAPDRSATKPKRWIEA